MTKAYVKSICRYILMTLSLFSPSILDAVPIIQIDNPSFRKLIAGVPAFVSSDPSLNEDAKMGTEKLTYFLNYSGLFNMMTESVYKDLLPQLRADLGKDSLKTKMQLNAIKTLGVESLTLAELKKTPEGPVLEIQTFDLNQGVVLLGKRFSGTTKTWLVDSLKVYANQILTAYTGLPGIFTSKIAFIGKAVKGATKQLYIADFDGSNVKQLTRAKMPVISPSWSNDGRYILFTSYADGKPDLFMYDLSTAKISKVAGESGLNSGGVFSPSDDVIAYTASVEGDTEIFVRKAKGGPRKLLISGNGVDVDPKFSPDGKWLAYVSGRFGNPHIFRAQIEWKGKYDLKIVGDKRLTYAGWYNAWPSWSPDSVKIAFAGYDKDIDRFDLFVMNNDGSNLERLTLNTGDNEAPSWSPNGQLLVFSSNRQGTSNRKGNYQLYYMRRDGAEQKLINTGLYEAMTPSWGPNL